MVFSFFWHCSLLIARPSSYSANNKSKCLNLLGEVSAVRWKRSFDFCLRKRKLLSGSSVRTGEDSEGPLSGPRNVWLCWIQTLWSHSGSRIWSVSLAYVDTKNLLRGEPGAAYHWNCGMSTSPLWEAPVSSFMFQTRRTSQVKRQRCICT